MIRLLDCLSMLKEDFGITMTALQQLSGNLNSNRIFHFELHCPLLDQESGNAI